MDRLELTVHSSESLDRFTERYELTEEAVAELILLAHDNMDLLSEALIKDLSSREAPVHVPAFLAGTQMTMFMLGYITCILAGETELKL